MVLPSHFFFLLWRWFYLNILAIDQARNGAWSVFDYESKTLIGYGTFSFDTKKYTYAKAVLHIDELIDLVIRAYDISAVFIEDINLRVNVQAFKRLAQLQGVLVNSFEKNEYLYGYIAPSQWQGFCKARGRNTKEVNSRVLELEREGKQKSKILSIQFVKEQFGIDTENDNLTDAICIGWYVVNMVELECPKKKKRSKSVRK
ncbi:crossover junction endodeoxyribonuclease RuvC [Intestinimonas butyriciproducens]|uniref:crossover junction endodeoxyribonuclease RuvC n=1 Tax=Intestinimonas butyriciproducens TaxID=1297617 RepID=UPI00189AB244|nr:crossover junction endodeoxyribonuclease RuvC [Intestinimonas butyriciproducens]MDB7829114.1 crossover junction endodeoxyribonuclease RuvC [Intestinimonas butyriciproducens]